VQEIIHEGGETVSTGRRNEEWQVEVIRRPPKTPDKNFLTANNNFALAA